METNSRPHTTFDSSANIGKDPLARDSAVQRGEGIRKCELIDFRADDWPGLQVMLAGDK